MAIVELIFSLAEWIKEVVIYCHIHPSHYELSKFALQSIMCAPAFFTIYVFSVKQDVEELDLDPNTASRTLPVDTEVLFDVLQLVINRLEYSESYSDFITPVMFGLYAAIKSGPNIKNILYQWIVQNMNWPDRYVEIIFYIP